MGFEYVSKLPTPDEIRAQFPLAPALAAEKAKKDEAIKDVFTGKSDKFLVIIGPCSADREDSVCEYVSRLAKVQEKVKSAVENMTGLEVADVNVKVAGVEMESQESAK